MRRRVERGGMPTWTYRKKQSTFLHQHHQDGASTDPSHTKTAQQKGKSLSDTIQSPTFNPLLEICMSTHQDGSLIREADYCMLDLHNLTKLQIGGLEERKIEAYMWCSPEYPRVGSAASTREGRGGRRPPRWPAGHARGHRTPDAGAALLLPLLEALPLTHPGSRT